MPYSVDDFKTRNMKLAGPIQPTYIDNGEGSTNSTLTTAETQKAIRDSDGGIMGSIKSVLDAAATKFTFGTTDRTEVAQQIGKNLNVNPDALMDLDQAGWNNVLMLNSQRSKVSDINDMYDNYPELRDIQYKSRAEATQLLQNMADAKKTRGLWDAVQQGIWSMNDQMKLADAAYQLANNQDEGKVDDLKNEISRLQENLKSYRTLGSNMTESIFEDIASQAYMMGKQAVVGTAKRAGQGMALGMGIGAAGGALAGGIGAAPGAVAGALTGLSYGVQTGMAEQMQHMSFGLKYLDLINKKDKNGNRIYTDQEARDRALAFSVVDTAIEFVAMKGAGKAIKGATPAASTLGKLMASRGAAETFQQGALATMENFVKTSVKAGSLELAEEGLQDINDKVQTNLWGKPGDTHYSVGDILTGSVQAMVDAAPAVLGLGILGGLGGGVRTASAFRQFNRLTPEMKNAVVQTEINTRGAQVLNAVIEDSKTNGLAKKNPELYAKVIQAQADKNGMSTVYINANDMVDTEEGQAVLQDLVNKGVVEQEAITKSIENDVPVEVPISSFAQMEEDITPENMKVLENNVHFTDGGMSMHAIEKAINTARTMQENFSSRSAAQREAVKGDILKEFDDTSYNDLQRQMAEQVIGTDPYRIKSNFNELYNRLDEEYREAYADDFKTLDFDQQSAEKPQWYADYVSENKRAPGAKARRRLAFEVAKERVNREYGTTATEEGKQIINDHYNEMEQKLNELEALDSIKDRMFAIADSDVHVRSSLSKEGFEVYNELSDLLKTGNLATAQQAKEAALLWAAHADVYADIVRSTGLRDYTAKDYMQQIEFEMNAQNAEEHNFSMHQFAGQSANNAPLEQLQTAKEMEANGKTSKDIWEATGWKKGSDDKWRFEIPDNLSGIDLDMLKVNKDTEVRLGEVYQNDRLYEAYPALENIMVEARDLKRAQGQSMFDEDPSYSYIFIDYKYLMTANEDAVKGTLIHELQHQIQAMEGFSRGGSPEQFKEDVRRRKRYVDNELAHYTYVIQHQHPDIYNEITDYEKMDRNSLDALEKLFELTENPDGIAKRYFDLQYEQRTLNERLMDVRNEFMDMYRNIGGEQEARETASRAINGTTSEPIIHDDNAIISLDEDQLQANNTFYQLAYHGTPYDFTSFDVEKIGSGVGKKSHGWGLYFAADKEVAEKYRKKLAERGILYTVDIPEANVLLDENKPIREQSPEIKKAVYEYMASRPDDYIINSIEDIDKIGQDGKWFYKELMFNDRRGGGYGDMKTASLTLKKLGIEGITYDDRRDGKCYVVFDDKAVKIIDKYQEKQAAESFYQRAYHGSPFSFERFDLGAVGSGNGGAVHGWGLYFAKNKEVSENYRKELAKEQGTKGSLVAAEIPDNDVLLHENVNYYSQPKEVRDKLDTLIESLSPTAKESLAYKLMDQTMYSPYKPEYQQQREQVAELYSLVDRMQTIYNSFDKQSKIKVRVMNRQLSDLGIMDVDADAQWTDKDAFQKLMDDVKARYEEANSNFEALGDAVKNPVTEEMVRENPALLLKESGNVSGRDIYNDLSYALGSDKEASLKLNQFGIKGIRYQDMLEGECFVVFDDTAVDIIREYNQSANQKRINGMTSFIGTDGQKLVQLFETANHSTFMHEAGHVFLEDLRMLANMPGIQEANEQVVKDWETIKEWTGYVEGADADTNRKAHEKFARGFEAYLREGKAPSKPLERAFRRFKDWLTALYENVLRVGGLPPKAVRDVMDRMLATKEAIDNYAAEQALEGFADSSFYKEMTDEDKTAYDKRLREIKDAAYETVHKEFLKEFEENAAKIDEQAVRDEVEQRLLEQYPIYKLSKNVEAIGDSVLAFSDYTSETLKKAENEEGMGPWPAVLDAETNRAIQAIKDNLSNPAYMASKAEEAFNSHEWQQRLAMEEAALIKKYANKAIARNYNLIAELSAINPDAPDAEERIAAVQKQINTKKDEKKNGPKQEDPAANRKVIDALKSELQSYIGNMRAMRNLSIGTVDDMMERAHRSLEDLSLSQATSFKHFQNKSITAARQADIAMAKGQMDEAFRQKQQQLLYQAMARAAYDNVEEVQSIEKDLKQKSVAMARPKNPVRIKGEARYFIQHLLYNMGLTSRDGIEPREGFTIESVMALLDPDAAILDEPSRVVFDQWVIDTFRDGKSWRQLTLSEFKQLAEIIRAVYTQGRSSYEGVSIINMDGEKISFDTAAQEMIEEGALKQSVEDPLNEKNKKGLRDAIADTANSYLSSLLKIETILRRYDGQKVGTWQRYIYEPIDRATRKGKEMLEKATKTLQANVNRYTKKELYTIRTEKRYAVGTIRNLTKENVIALALNWGTAANRQRVMETVASNEVNIEADFARILTDKDWDFIEAVWAQINSYYDERSAVQERMYGSPMRKEKGVNFTINGRKINGQYYPIVYDSTFDGNAKDYEVEDIIKSQMSSNAVWGMGMSATKERSRVVKGKKLMLSFDVIPRAVDEAINHIAMREAATDVNRLLNNRDLAEYISRTMGVDTLQLMKTWVRDNWQAEITRMSKWDRAVNTFKANTSMAIMAYRTSTAVLNVLNVIPAAKEIGWLNMLWALKSFYGGLAKNREFVKEHSVFMRERLQNLDKDLNKGLAVGSSGILYKEGTKAEKLSKAKRKADDAKEWVNRYAYQFITETDLMISMPVWKFAYERKVEAMLNEGITDAARIEEEAVTEADRTVRRVFGSGETKDTAAIQRNRNSIVSLFTPFYTYSNTVLNALVEAGYAVKDNRDYGMLFNTVLHWIVIQGLCEAIIRSLWDGDDDDWTTILPKAATSMFSTTLSGLPFIRDAAGLALDAILGKPAMSKGNETVALSIMPKMLDTVRAMKNEKKSWIDVMRSGNQVVNRMTGFSDTLTDGFWTLTKWSLMKTDATIQDLIAAIIFDRNIKSKKEKHK